MQKPSLSLASLSSSKGLLPFLQPLSTQKEASFVLCWVSRTEQRKKKKASLLCSSSKQHKATISTDFPNGYPEYDRLLPCPLQHVPPRVEHLIVSEGGVVLHYICKALHLPPLYVADLICFGAVHYALVSPKPPPSATSEQFRIYKEVMDPSILQKRLSIRGKTVAEAQKTFRITDVTEIVEAGSYLRVYVHPRRFPRCYEVDWKSRIIAVTDLYVVLDKPTATSVGGTTNNIEETCATFASRALGLETPLRTTHQLDNCTEGCVILARTTDFCSIFHGMIRENKVRKLYRALAAAPVPIGMISHFMRTTNRAPRLVSEDFIEGWHLCQLEVLECEEVPWPNASVEKSYNIDDSGWPSKKSAYECIIRLITGRTHQIRAQLGAIGAPVVGDSMYTPASMAQMANPHVNPFAGGGRQYVDDEERMKAIEQWISCHGEEPSTGIGLQASHISWDEGTSSYEAGTPWWRLSEQGELIRR